MSAVVVGLDLSLRSSGIAIIPASWSGDPTEIKHGTFGSSLKKDANEEQHLRRMIQISEELRSFVWDSHLGSNLYIALENYAFSKGLQPQAFRLRELGGIVKREMLDSFGVVPQPVIATAARKLAVGKLPRKNAKKEAHKRLHAAGLPVKLWGPDATDAFLTANWARKELGMSYFSF
jgi:hypothetical protein